MFQNSDFFFRQNRTQLHFDFLLLSSPSLTRTHILIISSIMKASTVLVTLALAVTSVPSHSVSAALCTSSQQATVDDLVLASESDASMLACAAATAGPQDDVSVFCAVPSCIEEFQAIVQTFPDCESSTDGDNINYYASAVEILDACDIASSSESEDVADYASSSSALESASDEDETPGSVVSAASQTSEIKTTGTAGSACTDGQKVTVSKLVSATDVATCLSDTEAQANDATALQKTCDKCASVFASATAAVPDCVMNGARNKDSFKKLFANACKGTVSTSGATGHSPASMASAAAVTALSLALAIV